MSELRNLILNGSSHIIEPSFRKIIYNLSSEVSLALNTNDLSLLHQNTDEVYSIRNVSNDDQTCFHKQFYTRLNSGWYDFIFLYHTLILEIKKFYKIHTELIFQKTPSFRVHLPGNLAVGEFHTDSKYNHPEGELNVSVPLTDAKSPRAILIQANDDCGNPTFVDMSCEHGELTLFNGNTLLHGNRVNTSSLTRVSFDFRLMTKSDYDRIGQHKRSLGQNAKFTMGEYYSKFTI